MNKLRVHGELVPYIVLLTILFSCKYSTINLEKYLFWKPMIDNFILFVLLIFMCINTNNWNWFSKRIAYSLVFILIVNTYAQLFGMSLIEYTHWYFEPLIIMIYVIVIPIVIEIGYELYTIIKWKD